MFHSVAKLLTFVVQPSSLLVLLIAAGVVLTWREGWLRSGRRMIACGAAGLVAAGILPAGNLMMVPLEQRYDGVAPPSGQVAGIILLGGFEDGWVSRGRGGLALNEAAERLTEGVRLALKHPQAKLVFTGGVGGFLSGGTDAAGPVGDLLADYGIARERIVLEDRARNTYENALFTADLVKPKPGERWVLVTSAYHMPRAIGVFRHAGFDVVPLPVDYRTRGTVDLTRLFERIGAGLERTDLAFKEWVGLAAYRVTGRTDALFPGPDDTSAGP
jgi:uncharacterized SAM-binding protein YcdF (DUF218 family)